MQIVKARGAAGPDKDDGDDVRGRRLSSVAMTPAKNSRTVRDENVKSLRGSLWFVLPYIMRVVEENVRKLRRSKDDLSLKSYLLGGDECRRVIGAGLERRDGGLGRGRSGPREEGRRGGRKLFIEWRRRRRRRKKKEDVEFIEWSIDRCIVLYLLPSLINQFC